MSMINQQHQHHHHQPLSPDQLVKSYNKPQRPQIQSIGKQQQLQISSPTNKLSLSNNSNSATVYSSLIETTNQCIRIIGKKTEKNEKNINDK